MLKPPAALDLAPSEVSVFLAGSIEMGRAPDWQTVLAKRLTDLPGVLLNPRRDDWDSSWRQDLQDARFVEQVEWELEAQEKATFVAFYFAPDTQAPVTLLELGLAARRGNAVVCCPVGFWRKGNVDLLCRRYRIPQVASLEALSDWIADKTKEPGR